MKENRIFKKCAINNYKGCNIWVMRISKEKREVREKETEEIMKQ